MLSQGRGKIEHKPVRRMMFGPHLKLPLAKTPAYCSCLSFPGSAYPKSMRRRYRRRVCHYARETYWLALWSLTRSSLLSGWWKIFLAISTGSTVRLMGVSTRFIRRASQLRIF
ncbi:hypothetical protein BDV93DRAFT_244069 [Ceratobasidium sp. AG-I]|nr:hypothetical protein BDV93DRAFT_244069 [Ceratobasidium sp. AG-I]